MKRLICSLFFLSIVALAAGALAGPAAKCIDVETASAKELTKLKGVGPALAKKIVDQRKKQRAAATRAKKPTWNFRNWANVLKVPGVGQQICQDNLKTLCFSGKLQKTCPKAPKKAKKATK